MEIELDAIIFEKDECSIGGSDFSHFSNGVDICQKFPIDWRPVISTYKCRYCVNTICVSSDSP